MNKSKSFAIIISVPVLSLSLIAYAQTKTYYFDLPTLEITKPAQPALSIIPSRALHVPFTRMDLTARGTDIIIEEITVQRIGPADDAAFDDILLLDGDDEELADGSLDDDHAVHFTEPIRIARNTTLHLLVAANMADDLTEFDGQASAFSITDIKASGFLPVNL